MKNSIMAGGAERLATSEEVLSRLRELHTAIRERYAEDLLRAGFFRSFLIHRRIMAEFRRERRHIEPSDYSLYGSRIHQ
jgi:hypothetical protein